MLRITISVLSVFIYTYSLSNANLLEFDITINEHKQEDNKIIYLEGDDYSTYDITRTKHYKYFSLNVNIGQPSQTFELMLDTGSCVPWVGADNATGLEHRKKYYTGISKFYSTEKEPIKLNYGAGSVEGYLFNDFISLGSVTPFQGPMSFVAGSSLRTRQNVGFDGIIGLGRIYKEDSACKPRQSLIAYLVDQRLVGKKIFSFKSFDKDRGKFYIGGYHSDFNNNKNQCKTINSKRYPNAWTCKLTFIKFGDNDSFRAHVNEEVDIDSGSQYISVPLSTDFIFETFYFPFLIKQGCQYHRSPWQGIVICPDTINFEEIPPIHLFLDDFDLKISAKHLFISRPEYPNEYQLAITFDKRPGYSIGVVFYEYHVLFDMEQQLIAFAKFDGIDEDKSEEGGASSSSYDYTVVLVLSVLSGVILIGVVVFCIIRKKRLAHREGNIGLNNNLL
jgi:hypothetical protein